MHIGLDFDNTIVCYDAIVHQHAVAAELVPENTPVSKRAVRDYLQANGQGDIWTEMQGYIYGVAVKDASPFPQLHAFLSECTDREIHLSIVSHKTPKPHLGAPYDCLLYTSDAADDA